ncbi:MAG: hypothetical protein QXU88_00560 [Candidatus Woesearchaeota archaeon]
MANNASPSKKAQIKMFENIAVLVIFFFLLAFGTSFYFTLQKSSLQREMERIAQLGNIQQALRLTFLPELDCSFAAVQTENCFDRLKFDALADQLKPGSQRWLEYSAILGFTSIKLKTVYSSLSPPPEEKLLYERKLNATAIRTEIPVLICENGCDPLNQSYSFGILEVTSYVRRAT